VIDTGIGIPASQQEAIFDEFHQLGNLERDRTKGLGLGLSIVQRVAQLLDHPIELESEPGRGARFSVTVPLGSAGRVAAEQPASSGDPRSDLVDLCVVVIDDEGSVREGMATLLAQWGCNVIAAASEDEAVAAIGAAAARPEVIIADYRLRGERTGVQAIARLRAEVGSALPALIVTGDTAPDRLREASASGHPLIHKPLQPALLRAFLRNARHRRVAAESA
jgi:CheY-like chemotaxis protein